MTTKCLDILYALIKLPKCMYHLDNLIVVHASKELDYHVHLRRDADVGKLAGSVWGRTAVRLLRLGACVRTLRQNRLQAPILDFSRFHCIGADVMTSIMTTLPMRIDTTTQAMRPMSNAAGASVGGMVTVLSLYTWETREWSQISNRL